METRRQRRHPSTFALSIAAVALGGAGCFAFTSPGPVGPMRAGNATQLSASWAYAYGPATATVSGQTISGNAQMQAFGNAAFPSALPVTVGIRQAIGDAAELSADLGGVDSGFRLRAGTPIEARVPFDVSLEARFGAISLTPSSSYQARAAFELYPNVTPANTFPPRWQILSIGVAGGVFQHQLLLPHSFDIDDDFPIGGPYLELLRPEVRLETAVGVYLGGKGEGVSIVVAPWFLLWSQAPTSASCPNCGTSALNTPVSLTSYSQSWGASLIITPSYGWLHPR